MCKKITFISLSALLFFVTSGRCFADVLGEFKQAEMYEKHGQYEQAELIYQQILADQLGTDDALAAQKNLICLYIINDNQPQAQAAFGKLLDEFAEHEKLPGTIHKISEQCHKSAKADKAILLYQHFIAIKPEHAIWLYMGVAISNILLGDETAAWAAAEKLLTDFSADQRCAEAVGQIAWCYSNLKQYENARSFYKHVVDNWPDNERAIFSQRGIVLTSIALGDDVNAETNIKTLLTRYSQNKHIAEVVTKIAYVYRESKEHEKARELYQYVVDNCPESKQAIWSQRGVVLTNIALGDEEAADTAIDNLLLRFSSHIDLAKAAHDVADCCQQYEKYDKAARLYQYALDHWSDIEEILWARAGMAKLDIFHGDDAAGKTAIDNLIAEFNGHPALPLALWRAAEGYYIRAFVYRKEGLDVKAEQYFANVISLGERIRQQLPPSTATAQAYFFSADCYNRLGQYQKAIEYHQKVVDNWPEYESAWLAQFRIAKTYKWLLRTGAISEDEAEAAIKTAFEKLIESFPDCPAANVARDWLEDNPEPEEGGQK